MTTLPPPTVNGRGAPPLPAVEGRWSAVGAGGTRQCSGSAALGAAARESLLPTEGGPRGLLEADGNNPPPPQRPPGARFKTSDCK